MSCVIWATRKLSAEMKISDWRQKFCIVQFTLEENNQLLDEETFKMRTEKGKKGRKPKQMDFSFLFSFCSSSIDLILMQNGYTAEKV